ncbi:hypothetical protein [Paenibacillus sp. CF384]|uniref:hypothetical protein n=1 Tax=Paenibacillus sp. CF384 TaxID=1884382 RepID=UPI0008974B6B|nr:hypothetical protein [Paenibacillus sp. CF384]SDX79903.1 hypothetical protein SAMN05518855_102224 [Paenibacillus sp. CF384]
MEKQEAAVLSEWIERSSVGPVEAYDVTRISMDGLPLSNFHQWSNGKPLVNAYHIARTIGGALYVLFIDWHRNDNYYMVIYAGDKSTTHAEIQKLVYDREGIASHLRWTYNPMKRDGGNAVRKAYFKQQWGGLATTIPILGALRENEADLFYDALFELVEKRLRADKAPELFDEI